jgi:putative SOS response-associated peptidase YedK
MCGRFTLSTPAQQIAALFGAEAPASPVRPRYNIAPTQSVPVLLRKDQKVAFAEMRWGLIPSWSRDDRAASSLVNARIETLEEKPSFRDSVPARRCLVPADGFFEWKTDGSRKVPHLIFRKDRQPFAFAGIWDRWYSPATGQSIESCAIVTTTANPLLRPLHERMPVMLTPEEAAVWLDPERTRLVDMGPILQPLPSESLDLYPVGTYVNFVRYDDPRCLEPVELPRQLTLWD